MANGINGIKSGSSYIGNSYVPQRQEKAPQEAPAEAPVIRDAAQVDGDQVLRFLEANAAVVNKPETTVPVAVSDEVRERIEATMPRFEEMMALMEDEFGPLAIDVMNLTMDKLI